MQTWMRGRVRGDQGHRRPTDQGRWARGQMRMRGLGHVGGIWVGQFRGPKLRSVLDARPVLMRPTLCMRGV